MVFYGLLTVLAVFASAGVSPKRDRVPAFWSGMIILAGWGLWTLSMRTEYGPAFWLYEIGVEIDPVEIWGLTDFISSAAILMLARGRWWSAAIWGLLSAQVILHCCYLYAGMEFAPYATALDFLYLGQLAVLFSIGGAGSVDWISDWYGRARHVPRKARAAQASKAE